MLEFRVPDEPFAAYMREKGHFATYGNVQLEQESDGKWRGSIDINGLAVQAKCTPTGPVSGGAGSRGMQTFFPPESSGMTEAVVASFAGHRIQSCEEKVSWTIEGDHAISEVVTVGGSNFQSEYTLAGGAFGSLNRFREAD